MLAHSFRGEVFGPAQRLHGGTYVITTEFSSRDVDENGIVVLERDDFIKPDTDMQKLGSLRASFEGPGKMGFDAVALAKYPQVERINHVHTPGNSSGIVDGASLVMVGSAQAGKDLGLDPRGCRLQGGHTGYDPHRNAPSLGRIRPVQAFEHQRRHGIDPGIPRAHERDGLAGGRETQRLVHPGLLLAEGKSV